MNLIHDFKNLIQIQSLESAIARHMQNIEQQKARIDHLDKQIELRKNELNIAKTQLETKQTHLEKTEGELNTVSENLQKSQKRLPELTSEAQCKAVESEIQNLSEKKETLEEQTLELMEEIESLEETIQDATGFIQGSVKTRQELKLEVNANETKEQKQIDNAEERISALLEIVSEIPKRKFVLVDSKFRFKSPLAIIEGKNCQRCRMSLETSLIHKVELAGSVEQCPGCQRILIPESAIN